MRTQVLVFLGAFVVIYLGTLCLWLLWGVVPLANALGFLALLCYFATLLPTCLRIVFPQLKRHKALLYLLKRRRQVGVAAFGFGANHGVLLVFERQINFLTLQTYFYYFQGLAMLAIFFVLTLTSNDESVRYLKRRWKKIHQWTYWVLLLLPWHILDKMSGHWTYLTPVSIAVVALFIPLFLKRQWIEQALPQPQQLLSQTLTTVRRFSFPGWGMFSPLTWVKHNAQLLWMSAIQPLWREADGDRDRPQLRLMLMVGYRIPSALSPELFPPDFSGSSHPGAECDGHIQNLGEK